uniref:Uncharacterized protein n=1 Tax=Oryza punctata TaxID=4537 RepID=A0A0E0MIW0_ORYPU
MFSFKVLSFKIRFSSGPFRNQVDSFIFWIEILVLGLGSMILYNNFWSLRENQLGHLKSPCWIFRYISIKFGPWKGR